ncbi:MAG: hypothetical protein JWO31_2082 [Phycisphaerales bacterium]|nr:hypothetical protein [Phycisphaerales bacterium]
MSFYLKKQKSMVIRHLSDDRMVAVIEIVSPGNKSSASAISQFIDKATTLLLNDVHLMIVDLFPPGLRDPKGVHAAVWEDVAGQAYDPPASKPLATIAYEAFNGNRAFVQHLAVGDLVPDTPLFLARDACVTPPLDATYTAAFAAMPLRWRQVLERD